MCVRDLFGSSLWISWWRGAGMSWSGADGATLFLPYSGSLPEFFLFDNDMF